MYSRAHLLISLVVGAAVILAWPPPVAPVLVLGYAAVLGVGIDFDHFLLARHNQGDWRALRGCLRDPRRVVLDQSAIFEDEAIHVLERLLSHVVIGGLLVAALALVSPYLAVVSAVVLYAHVLADLVADNREEGTL